MSWFGLQVAKLFGQKLPTFTSQATAEAELHRERDERLQRISELAVTSGTFAADYTPESLKTLEKWYFELWESEGFRHLSIQRDEFERCMAIYFCEVAVQNCPDTKWEVREYAFEQGKYEIGVQRGPMHYMRSRFKDHYKEANNKRRQKMYREYQQLFAA